GFPEIATAVAIDAGGNAYIGGTTSSKGFATPQAFQSTPKGGGLDGFVAKFDASGNALFRTYLGGSNADYVTSIAIASDGLLVAGYTASPDFPVVTPVQSPGG